MAGASQLIVHYDRPKKNCDGKITIERVGGSKQSRPANVEGLAWARQYIQAARAKGFSVDDLALAKAKTK